MNANEKLREYNSTEGYYRHQFGLLFTDGVYALCELFKCYWFIDIVASYQPKLRHEEFQVWKLIRTGSTAIVVCEDGNHKLLVKQNIPFTDFDADQATVWVENNVILLPSEH